MSPYIINATILLKERILNGKRTKNRPTTQYFFPNFVERVSVTLDKEIEVTFNSFVYEQG